ncbi:glycosyltransferase [Jeotgalibaca ciconiae]|uniref:Glycosyltransferase n=1 Tax=Jeotgalibaca ciconiae TaxID=2496265 RepID=A0A3Q9BLA1_9LACT|nr:glycosyltransferase family 2 protein [Jeotgalibaca ciconiae]AZP04934.1 glycosyltransferase [Jeotgalibaca ciconiae]
MEIGIVILNYLNWQDTVECINSLENQTYKDYQVIVVDNSSTNESFKELYKRYGKENDIHLLQSEENLGFAKGNNIGILYCKDILDLKNILVINNDVIFTEPTYIEHLANYEIGNSVGVIGTKIIGSDGKNQNPSAQFRPSARAVLRELSFPLIRKYHLSWILKIGSFFKKNIVGQKQTHKVQEETSHTSNSKKQFALHGSALYLTQNYLSKINGFYPDTFLYYEEEILALVCHKLHLQMVYTDEIEIYHKEDQSSKLSFNNEEGIKYEMGRKSVRVGLKVSLMSINKIKAKTNHYPYNFKMKKNDIEKEYHLQS